MNNKIKNLIHNIAWRIFTALILTLAVSGTIWAYANFTEPASNVTPWIGATSTVYDFSTNILGANNSNNMFNGSAVQSNYKGSIIERTQYLGQIGRMNEGEFVGEVDSGYYYCLKKIVDSNGMVATSSVNYLNSCSATGSCSSDGRCLLAINQSCSSNGQCASNYCYNSLCKISNGQACSSDNQCGSGYCVQNICKNIAVGDNWGGGIVFDTTNRLIGAISNVSAGIRWCLFGIAIPGARSDTDGAANTTAMVAGCTGDSPATLCRAIGADWYVPAKNQLDKLYQERTSFSGLNDGDLWSSTESAATLAWSQRFSTGVASIQDKGSIYRVRCIRSY